MAKTRSKSAAAGKPASKSRKPAVVANVRKQEEEAYTRSLIAHRQAVKVPAGGKLPPGATHELVEDSDGTVRPVRRRFSVL